MIRHSSWLLGLSCLLFTCSFACGGSTATVPSSNDGNANNGSGGDTPAPSGGGGSASNTTPASVLNYESPCEPSSCPGSPSGDSNGAATCSSNASGACGWSPGSPGASAGSSGGGGVTSYSPCADKECGAIPAIACAPGYSESTQCGSLNGAACAWQITCSAEDTGKACSVANGCGDAEPAIAPLCDGGVGGSMACHETTAGTCEWAPVCP